MAGPFGEDVNRILRVFNSTLPERVDHFVEEVARSPRRQSLDPAPTSGIVSRLVLTSADAENPQRGYVEHLTAQRIPFDDFMNSRQPAAITAGDIHEILW